MAQTNDWIVATLNNPNFNPADMQDILGLNVNNTQILSRDKYLESPYIKNHEAFKNDDGSFSNQKFNDFYNYALSTWDQFTSDEKIDSFQYSLFDTRAKSNSLIRDPHFRFETIPNPDRVNIGISGINTMGDRKYTPSELAQMQPIYDSKSGKYLNETPNDRALFNHPLQWVKNLFQDPLVLATYDQDTEEFDPFTGKTIKHKKGEYKLNQDGTYYAETLNGRSTAGKQIIANTDLITLDDSSINKYDFFDSDSLDKSVGGTIMKTASTILPLFLGPHVRAIYSGLLIGRELVKSLPMLYGMATSLFGNESDPEILNTFAGYGEKFTGGISEYGSQHTFSFEQFGRLIGDVATQWGQQQLIARSISKLRGSNSVMERAYKQAYDEYSNQLLKIEKSFKEGQLSLSEAQNAYRMAGIDLISGKKLVDDWTKTSFGKIAWDKYRPAAEAIVKRNARLGADAALAYMAIVSNYDIYNNMLERGATHKDAALVSLGSTIGMFSVDKFLHLGEMFFDDLEDQAQIAFRNYVRNESKELINSISQANGKSVTNIEGNLFKRIGSNLTQKNIESGEANLLRKSINFGKATAEEFSNSVKYYKEGLAHHTLGAAGKALGEGLEEVSEEFVSDISKQLYEWAGQLGYNTSVEDAGAWDNWFERYAMSLFGGAIGGAVFYGVGQFDKAKYDIKNSNSKSAEDELIYLLRQGKKRELLSNLEDLKNKGKLGSTVLGLKTEQDENGNTVFLKAKDKEITQNEAIYDIISREINILDSYITEYGGNLSEDELFKQMVLGDDRLMTIKEQLNGASYNSGYRQEFQEILTKVYNLSQEINNSSELTDLQKRRKELESKKEDTSEVQRQLNELTKNINSKQKQLEEYTIKLNDFLNGKRSLEFARKTVWLSDPVLSSNWTYNTFDQWLKVKHNLSLKSLSKAELEKYQNEYLNDLNLKKDFDTEMAWKSFLQMEKDFTPFLTNLENNSSEVTKIKQTLDNINQLRNEIKSIMQENLLTYDDKLDDETSEEFEHRNDYLNENLDEDARNELFKKYQSRLEKIETKNNEYRFSVQNIKNKLEKILNSVDLNNLDPLTYRNIRILYSSMGQYETGETYSLTRSFAVNNAIQDALRNPEIHNLQFETIKQILIVSVNNIIEIIKRSSEIAMNQFNKINEISNLFETNPEEALKLLANNDTFRSILEHEELFEGTDEEIEQNINNFIQEIVQNNENLNKIKNSVKSIRKEKLNNIKQFFNDDLSNNILIEELNTINEELEQSSNFDELNETVQIISMFNSDNSKNIIEINNIITNGFNSLTELMLKANSEDEISNCLNIIFAEVRNNLREKIDSFDTKRSLKNKFYNNINEILNQFISVYQSKVNEEINNNVLIKFINKINNLTKNPLVDILSIISSKYGISEVNLEVLLNKLQEKIDSEIVIDDFKLDSQEEASLDYLDHILNLVSSFIYQSSKTPNWLSSQGHAKFWNDFANKNKETIGEFHLPEIDFDLAQLYIQEINLYKEQIKAYKNIHSRNAINKEQQFNTAGRKLEDCKIKFYKGIFSQLHDLQLNGLLVNKASVNLLDEIKDDDTSLDIESKLATNLFNFLQTNNISFKDFLSKTKILENILPNRLEDIPNQDPSDLDDKLEYDNISAYQRLQFLITALLHNSGKFESYNKQSLKNELAKEDGKRIAPIPIQKQIIQTVKGFINSQPIIKELYEYLEENMSFDVPVLTNCIIIEGAGGVGKTGAIIKKSIEDLESKDIWIAAPKKNQLTTLSNSIGTSSKSFDRTQLLLAILENKSEYDNSVKNSALKKQTGDKYFEKKDEIYFDTGKLKLKVIDNAPKVLVIDEATHFSYFDIQIINRWAKINGIQVILLGHSHQLGALEGDGFRHSFTLFRTPILRTSLRESNIHVQNNNSQLDNTLDQIEELHHGLNKTNVEEFNKNVQEKLSKVNLTYYLTEEKLNGTVITKQLTSELLDAIKSSKSICFIGDETSKILDQLKSLGIIFKQDENLFNSIFDVQGNEFDYVISDVSFKLPKIEGNEYGDDAVNQVKLLYTLNTRAKEGLIILDKDFSQFYNLTNSRSSNTAQAKTIKDAVNSFINKESERLNNLNLDGDYHDLSELNISEKTIVDDSDDVEKSEEKSKEEFDGEIGVIKNPLEDKSDDEGFVGDDDIIPINIIGYSTPILGGYTRTQDKDGKNVYSKLEDLNINGTRVLRDLEAVTYLNKEIKGNKLSVTHLQQSVSSYFNLLKQIASVSNGVNLNITDSLCKNYISSERLLDILQGKSTELLSDGRTEGVYLEAQDYNDGDRFIGLGESKDDDKSMLINGKVYKYVLRFKPTTNQLNNTEIAITLALASRPETWETKILQLSDQIKKETNPDVIKSLTEEKNNLQKNINSYRKYLEKLNPNGVKVKIDGAFSKIRQYSHPIRYSTLAIDNPKRNGKTIDYEAGWLEKREGKYKVVSDIYILGNDLDKFGIKASNSGKAVIFVSDFYYKKSQLMNIYLNEKASKQSKCTVRMIILNNAGINWSTLTNKNYKELYRGQDNNQNFPFKSDVMGYRFLVAMWNWRADLTNFLNLYNKEFSDYSDNQVLRIIGANDEIYAKHKNIPENLTDDKDILEKYEISEQDIIKLNKFNNEICKNIHTFRLGAFTNGKRIQRLIGIDLKNYFGESRVPNEIKSGKQPVMGLAITPQKAKEYYNYINALFSVFNQGSDVLDIHISRNGKDTKYNIDDRINGDKLGSLTKFKNSDETRASGNSFTNFLDGVVNSIEVNDGEKSYNIKFLGNRHQMSQFMVQVTHLYYLLKLAAYLNNMGIQSYDGKIKLYKNQDTDGEFEELNYSELKNLVLNSVSQESINNQIERILSNPERGEFRFELGDMFDLMLHGSVQDVSTHSLETENGQVVGGRESNLKITGAMFPNGMYIDPRQTGLEKLDNDENKHSLLKTSVDPRLMLISSTTDLVYNIILPTSSEENDGQDGIVKTYEFNTESLSIKNIENIPETINGETLIGNKKLKDLIPNSVFPKEFVSVGNSMSITYNNEKYTLYFEKVGEKYNIQLEVIKPVQPAENKVNEIKISEEDWDYICGNIYDLDVKLSEKLTLKSFIEKALKNANINLSIENLKLDTPSNGIIQIKSNNNELIGNLEFEDNKLSLKINPELLQTPSTNSTDEENTGNITIPDIIPSTQNYDLENPLRVIDYFIENSNSFNISEDQLKILNNIKSNEDKNEASQNVEKLIFEEWLAEAYEKISETKQNC